MTTRREFLLGTGASLATVGALQAGGARRAAAQAVGEGAGARMPLIDRVVPPRDTAGRRPLVVSTWRHGVPGQRRRLAGAGRRGPRAGRGRGGRARARGRPRGDECRLRRPTRPRGPRDAGRLHHGRARPGRRGRVPRGHHAPDQRGAEGDGTDAARHAGRRGRAALRRGAGIPRAGPADGQGARRVAGVAEDLASTQPWTPPTDPRSTSSARPGGGGGGGGKEGSGRRGGDNHDTISMLAIDAAGNLSGACTTSGLAYKMHGRVGDSPIIGAALFVDNEVGAACATGVGEEVMKTLGSFLIVELMRQGATPQQACEEGIARIRYRHQGRRPVEGAGGLPGDRPAGQRGRLRHPAVVPVRDHGRRRGRPAGRCGQLPEAGIARARLERDPRRRHEVVQPREGVGLVHVGAALDQAVARGQAHAVGEVAPSFTATSSARPGPPASASASSETCQPGAGCQSPATCSSGTKPVLSLTALCPSRSSATRASRILAVKPHHHVQRSSAWNRWRYRPPAVPTRKR